MLNIFNKRRPLVCDFLPAYERLYGSALRHFCNTVVWIAELVHVKKSWKLVEINLTTLF